MTYPDVPNGVRDTNILYERACRAYSRRKPYHYPNPSCESSEVDWVGGGSAVVYLANTRGVYAEYWYDAASDRLHFISEEERKHRLQQEQERQKALTILEQMGNCKDM